jgi:hypothetical protein
MRSSSWGLWDKAVLSSLLTKAVQGLAGPVTAILILFYFDPEVQGYHYTFLNLLALQIFVELGLSTVITIFAAHEWSTLSFDEKQCVTGDPHSFARLAVLAKRALRWYVAGACILLLVLYVAGSAILNTAGGGGRSIDWHEPWMALCILSAAGLALTPGWALLLGCGQVAEVNRFRMWETIGRSLVLWAAIASGAQLWAIVLSAAFSVAWTVAFLVGRYLVFFRSLLTSKAEGVLDWKREVAPLQWRIAISWICGYFAFSIFTPVMFLFLGPMAAGQMGITWAIVSGVSGLAATWAQVRSPAFANLVARKEFAALDSLAVKIAAVAVTTSIAASLVVISGLLALDYYRPDLAVRFLPVAAIAVFLLADFPHQLSIVQSTYLRAFKREPFLSVSVVSGAAIGIGTIMLTGAIGPMGPALSYLTGILLALSWGSWVFVQNWRKWTFPRENK